MALPSETSDTWSLLSPPHFLPAPQRQVEVNVRNKILYLIQAWAHAFRNEPKYKVVQDTYQIMKVEGKLEQPQPQAENTLSRSHRVVFLATLGNISDRDKGGRTGLP
jgi:hypothetical protein